MKMYALHLISMRQTKQKNMKSNIQFQQRKIRIAIVRPFFTLLSDVVLKYGRRFRVISVETVEYGIDVLWPFGRSVEGDSHFFLL